MLILVPPAWVSLGHKTKLIGMLNGGWYILAGPGLFTMRPQNWAEYRDKKMEWRPSSTQQFIDGGQLSEAERKAWIGEYNCRELIF